MIVATGPRLSIQIPPLSPPTAASRMALLDVEREHILRVLDRTAWRIRGPHGAAQALGLKPTTLEARMVRLGLHRPARN